MTYRIDMDSPGGMSFPPNDFLQIIIMTAWQTGFLALLVQTVYMLITGASIR